MKNNFVGKLKRWIGCLMIVALAGSVFPACIKDADASSDKPEPVKTMANLRSLLEKVAQQPIYFYGEEALQMDRAVPEATKEANASPAPTSAGAADDYSRTNLQVAGVDEADTVKTDGNYIYKVNGQEIQIIKAVPAGKMELVSTISYQEGKMSPRELYVSGNTLTVVGGASFGDVVIMQERSAMPYIYPPPYIQESSKVVVYDITNRSKPVEKRSFETEGYYLSSRRIGNSLYLLANRNMLLYRPLAEVTDQELVPTYRDSAAGGKAQPLDLSRVWCLPNFSQPSYLVVAGIDLGQHNKAADVTAYLGSGENVYASTGKLYATMTDYSYPAVLPDNKMPANVVNTKIFRFGLQNGQVTFESTGQVPGTILNQFSMDEYRGNFRIATTTGNMWDSGEATSKNNLYVLDSKMQMLGSVTGMAPGERIYSVRFMGDRAYVVTFKDVDPLFVIDLKNPAQPKILGALKIPGYSDYLHPYDATHLIGFGKDTISKAVKDSQGKVVDTRAYYAGMKMALFDVTDPTNPKEIAVVKIGDRGTDSELLHNHKALLFSREKGLIAFPVTVATVKDPTYSGDFPEYGEFTFQGAYVYNIDLAKGFTMQGKITHLSPEDYQKSGYYWYDSDKNIQRILFIGSNLYTLSNAKVQANVMGSLGKVGELPLKK
jgi:uncharacterized secreted protein with C-terminal beta-propeller domain